MHEEAIIMGMPVTIHIVDKNADSRDIKKVFEYFREVDAQFSTYKPSSEVSKINDGTIGPSNYSSEMKKVLALCEETKKETNGYFNIKHDGKIDPSGLVKGYAIWNGSKILLERGYKNFYIEIAGDIQTSGHNPEGTSWKVGLENPFNRAEIIQVVELSEGEGIATSGTYIRGNHIYNPHTGLLADSVASVTVIAKNVYEADRFATSAFVMGRGGIEFIEKKPGLSGFLVTKEKTSLRTSNFGKYITT